MYNNGTEADNYMLIFKKHIQNILKQKKKKILKKVTKMFLHLGLNDL